MRIKLKYPDIDTFIQKYAVNISRGGIFIATKQPKPIGTYLRFEFLLSDDGATSIIRGEGQVQWTKDYDAATPGKPHGMGVKFMRLDADSQAVIDRALRWRADHGTSPNVALPVSSPVSSAQSINTRDDYDRTSESPPLEAQLNDPERTARVNVPELLARAGTAEPPDETARVDLPEMLARTAGDGQEDRLGVPQAVPGVEPTDRVNVAQLPHLLTRADEDEETVIGQHESPLYVRPPPSIPAPSSPPPLPSSAASSANDGLRNGELASREGSLVGQLPTRASSAAAQARRENGQHVAHEAPPRLEPAAVGLASATAPLPDRRGETRPIAIEHRDEHGRSPQDSTREIALTTTATWPKRRDELDQLASEWGLTEERLQRTLKRTVRPRIAEATAELERLLLKPPKPPTPTIAEAIELLGALLARRRGRNGTPPRG